MLLVSGTFTSHHIQDCLTSLIPQVPDGELQS